MSTFAQRIKARGALACLQITHGGMWAWQYAAKRGLVPFATSFVVDSELGDYSVSKRKDLPASEERIYEIIQAYGNAALRAKNCGFDAVEVHAAHESLLAQFLSPVSNIRNDRWGGNVENRSRFHCEIFKDIRKKVGADFPVIVKLGVRDALAGGLELMEEVVEKQEADFVSMCRPYIREHLLIRRWMGGDRKKATCISCNKCITRAYTEGKRLECVFENLN